MIDTRPFFPVPGFDIENPQWLFSRSDVEQSIRPPPACRDDCHVCTATYYTVQDQEKPQFSYRSRLSNREAEQVCQVLVGQIHDHRTYITQILEKHADDLVARWSKKGRFGSQSKRDELLKVVAPDLSTSHRCIVSVVYSEDGERQYICSRSLATRRKLLLPWLNREILKTHPDALFALLYYRTAYGPQDWANFDATNIKEHFVQGSYDVDWAEKPIDIRGHDTYGTLTEWNAAEIHRAELVGFPFGQLILEAQAYLMGVLRNIVDKLLEGMDPSRPNRTEKWQCIIQACEFKRTGDIETWSPNSYGAFCQPSRFDATHLLSLAQTRRERSEDHLRALQCNLPYLRRQMQLITDSVAWKEQPEAAKGAYFAGQLFSAATDFCYWRLMEDEIRRFSNILDENRQIIAQEKLLPFQYDRALGALELFILGQVLHRGNSLVHDVAGSPGFSQYWVWTSPDDNYSNPMNVYRIDGGNNSMAGFDKDFLDWFITHAGDPPDATADFDFPMLFTMLTEFLSQSPLQEKERLGEYLSQKISDLATCHELLTSLRLHMPPSSAKDSTDFRETENRLAWRIMSDRTVSRLRYSQLRQILGRIGCILIDSFAKYDPTKGEAGSRGWMEKQRILRFNVGSSWKFLRELILEEFRAAKLSPEEEEYLFGIFSSASEPQDPKPIEAQETTILTGAEKGEEKGQAETQAVARESSKGSDVPDIGKLSLTDQASPTLGPIPVSQQFFVQVFSAMFPITKAEARRGVEWDTFTRAMKSLGFAVSNSGGGFDILFKHQSFGEIIFAKPCPELNIDPVLLRFYGTRLSRRFKWRRERFVINDG